MNRLLTLLPVLGLGLASAQAGAAGSIGDAAAGRELAQQVCESCHGPDGNPETPQFPRIAGQHASYLAKALQDYKDGKRNNAMMNGIASSLSPEDMRNLAEYYSRQEGPLHVKEPPTF